MLKKLIGLTLTLCAMQTVVAAPANVINIPILCSDSAAIQKLVKEYNEVAISGGMSNRETTENKIHSSPIVLFANIETGTWTLIERIDPEVYCITATGRNFKHLQKKELY